MTISDAMSLCHKNGVIVYPTKGRIAVKKEGFAPLVYQKIPSDLNLALEKTYFHEAKKLKV
jgi:hypothetical protein